MEQRRGLEAIVVCCALTAQSTNTAHTESTCSTGSMKINRALNLSPFSYLNFTSRHAREGPHLN